ncbi:ornithine cyclodeaminase family protein [Mariniluteicoccus endophyticus]
MVNDALILSSDDITSLFTPEVALESQRRAFAELGHGRAQLPARLLIDGREESTAFCYAARTNPDGAAVSKFGSVNPANADRGLPTISALVVVLDPVTGRPAAVMDGTLVTTLRTAAASAVAIDALAGDGPVAIVGSGVQARAHLTSLPLVRPDAEYRITSLDLDAARRLADGADRPVEVFETVQDAVEGAAVVLTATTSPKPLLEASWISPGAVVMSIGSFAADRHEVGQDLVKRADLVVVDHVETCLEHAGPVVEAVRTGLLQPCDLVALGDVAVGNRGRASADEIVYVNSVGIGVQDAAAAEMIVGEARRLGLGSPLAL